MSKMELAKYKQLVRDKYSKTDTKWLAQQTGRTVAAIHVMANRLGVHKDRSEHIYNGYRYLLTDPSARGQARYTQEHRVVMEKKIGRPLTPQERVHHIDGDPLNNAPENLRLYANAGHHCAAEHYRQHYSPSKETRAKIQAALKITMAKHPRRHSQETKDKISRALKGKPKSEEHRRKLAASQRKYHRQKKQAQS